MSTRSTRPLLPTIVGLSMSLLMFPSGCGKVEEGDSGQQGAAARTAAPAASDRTEAPRSDDPAKVSVGDFTMRVVDWGFQSVVGISTGVGADAVAAKGIFLVVLVDITNESTGEKSLLPGSFTLTDGQGRDFTESEEAMATLIASAAENSDLEANRTPYLKGFAPGSTSRCLVAFDVPRPKGASSGPFVSVPDAAVLAEGYELGIKLGVLSSGTISLAELERLWQEEQKILAARYDRLLEAYASAGKGTSDLGTFQVVIGEPLEPLDPDKPARLPGQAYFRAELVITDAGLRLSPGIAEREKPEPGAGPNGGVARLIMGDQSADPAAATAGINALATALAISRTDVEAARRIVASGPGSIDPKTIPGNPPPQYDWNFVKGTLRVSVFDRSQQAFGDLNGSLRMLASVLDPERLDPQIESQLRESGAMPDQMRDEFVKMAISRIQESLPGVEENLPRLEAAATQAKASYVGRLAQEIEKRRPATQWLPFHEAWYLVAMRPLVLPQIPGSDQSLVATAIRKRRDELMGSPREPRLGAADPSQRETLARELAEATVASDEIRGGSAEHVILIPSRGARILFGSASDLEKFRANVSAAAADWGKKHAATAAEFHDMWFGPDGRKFGLYDMQVRMKSGDSAVTPRVWELPQDSP